MATPEQKLSVEAWRRAGPRLQQVRDAELRNLTEERAVLQAVALSCLPTGIPLRPSSGLVEFQRWMQHLACQAAAAGR
jgi:hypothetical protein